jgi:uncharacterized protein with HEPN domain
LPSERPEQRLADIIEQSDRVFGYIAGHTFETYERDHKTCDAVERCLSRVSEAASKLGAYLDDLYPEARWRDARAIGNILRHRYDEVVHTIIWDSVMNKLPALRASAAAELKRLMSSD